MTTRETGTVIEYHGQHEVAMDDGSQLWMHDGGLDEIPVGTRVSVITVTAPTESAFFEGEVLSNIQSCNVFPL